MVLRAAAVSLKRGSEGSFLKVFGAMTRTLIRGKILTKLVESVEDEVPVWDVECFPVDGLSEKTPQ